MIHRDVLIDYLRRAFPDATVTLSDRTGAADHYGLQVVSEAFADKDLLDRNRMVYRALDEPLRDGRLHAIEIKALTPRESA